MTRQRRIRIALLTCAVTSITVSAATSASAQPSAEVRPRIGLVLSGGAAKGLSHVGVLQALHDAGVPIDVVTGTSMGSLVGGLYAVGMAPDSIARLARSLDWGAHFNDQPLRRFLTPAQRAELDRTVLSLPIEDGALQLPSGVVRGSEIYRLLSRLTWAAHDRRDFATLPVPFRAVATDLETGQAVVLEDGVLADAMRASLAIPGVFTPFERDGRLLLDGGIVRNLPAADARSLGAEFVICSDVSAPLSGRDDLRSLVDVLLQTISFQMTASTDAQRALCDVVITPEAAEGSLFAFDDAAGWIARGASAARAALPRIPHRGSVSSRAAALATLLPDTVRVRGVVILGVDDPAALRIARRVLGPLTDRPVTATRVDAALRALHATGEFGQTTYRVDAIAGDTTLVFTLAREQRSQFGIGLRYDDTYGASLLFTATIAGLPAGGSATTTELRLGEQLQVGAQTKASHGSRGQFVTAVDVGFLRLPIPLYNGGLQVAEVTTDVWDAGGFAGLTALRGTLLGLRVAGELHRASVTVAPRDSGERSSHVSIGALLWRDSFDHGAFPTSGSSIYLKSEWAADRLGGGLAFGRHVADVRRVRPLGQRAWLVARAGAGYAHGDRLPFLHLFRLGGAFATSVLPEHHVGLLGAAPLELPGRAMQVGSVGLRTEVASNLFVTAVVEAGGAFDTWRVAPDEYRVGTGLSVGAPTLLGPIQVSLSTRRLDGPLVFRVNVGHGF